MLALHVVIREIATTFVGLLLLASSKFDREPEPGIKRRSAAVAVNVEIVTPLRQTANFQPSATRLDGIESLEIAAVLPRINLIRSVLGDGR